ncbi:replication protein C [Roseibium sp. TrichSKD4]|uniref:plasmid replication protein RepC n=1 Tax=Roseibium sp. TrichSKD4 TaxID=744980 RepID=UPI0001E565E4|nr:plasmid replication protein RepC [Roseibium sp. TrichSKD4]EFO34019.1 replication protein C [Roseibium sp. TrichSKD4]
METTNSLGTTPFGGGRFSIALFKAQKSLNDRRAALKDGSNITGKVDKWQFLRALTEAKAAFALTDRAIAVLEALMSFHQEKELDGTEDIIVFPSNRELSLRARGMSEPTLRRHVATLIKAGFLLRKDSPNGKRFARKGQGGLVEEAFGFNLAPSALMAPDVFEEAEKARHLALELRKARGEVTLHLRDISKMIEAAYEDGIAQDDSDQWFGFTNRLKDLSGRVSRHASLQETRDRCQRLVSLRVEVESAFLAGMREEDLETGEEISDLQQSPEISSKNKKNKGNAAQNERHIQNSKTDTSFEPNKEKNVAEGSRDFDRTETESIRLSELKEACREFPEYALDGLNSWADARKAANLARPMLGISKNAWHEAVEAMGQGGAIVVLAYLIERAGEIKTPGGYLRSLTDRASTGKLRLRPMVESLLNR